MRALCGAIVTAGGLIGLGLAAIGFGTRYQSVHERNGEFVHVLLRHTDNPLLLVLFMLSAGVIIGLATMYVGLAYHHERRHREQLRDLEMARGRSERL